MPCITIEAELHKGSTMSFIKAKQDGIIDALEFSLRRWVLKE